MMLGIAEILDRADKAKVKEEKIAILQKNATGTLVDILRLQYDEPRYEWALEAKKVDYKASPYLDNGAALYQNLKKVPRYFLKGMAEHLSAEKKEQLYIQFLEGLNADDAALIEGIRTRKFPYKTLTKTLVKSAFPDYIVSKAKEDARQ